MKSSEFRRSAPMKRTMPKVPRADPKPPRGPKLRKCAVKSCRAPFEPSRPFVTWCSDECGALVALDRVAKQNAKAARAERVADKAKLEQFKPLSYWEKIAETHCNAYIRARDPDICISCGVMYSSAWQAGHYKSVGSNATLRYNELNINKQCIKCNFELGGNAIQYRIGLVAKIGLERVEWLEGWHAPVKMTADAAKEIAEHYKAKLKALRDAA